MAKSEGNKFTERFECINRERARHQTKTYFRKMYFNLY